MTIFKSLVLTTAIIFVGQAAASTITQISNEMDGQRAFVINDQGIFPIEAKGKFSTPLNLKKEIAITTPLGVFAINSIGTKINTNLSPYSYSNESSQSAISGQKAEIVIENDGEITITGV